jgi:hypothetical protein
MSYGVLLCVNVFGLFLGTSHEKLSWSKHVSTSPTLPHTRVVFTGITLLADCGTTSASRHRYLDLQFQITVATLPHRVCVDFALFVAFSHRSWKRQRVSGHDMSFKKPNLPCLCTHVMIAHGLSIWMHHFCPVCFSLLLLFTVGSQSHPRLWSR